MNYQRLFTCWLSRRVRCCCCVSGGAETWCCKWARDFCFGNGVRRHNLAYCWSLYDCCKWACACGMYSKWKLQSKSFMHVDHSWAHFIIVFFVCLRRKNEGFIELCLWHVTGNVFSLAVVGEIHFLHKLSNNTRGFNLKNKRTEILERQGFVGDLHPIHVNRMSIM